MEYKSKFGCLHLFGPSTLKIFLLSLVAFILLTHFFLSLLSNFIDKTLKIEFFFG